MPFLVELVGLERLSQLFTLNLIMQFSFLTKLPFFSRAGKVTPINANRTWSKNVVRIVCISDTHGKETSMPAIPLGDVLIHAGDFTSVGSFPEIEGFKKFVQSLKHPQKIVIAGNHEITLEPEFYQKHGIRFHSKLFRMEGFDPIGYSEDCCEEICISEPPMYNYLQDSSVRILTPFAGSSPSDSGIEVYGAPWQPEFCNWAFNLYSVSALKEKWDLIPNSTDVLITHGPPYMILDRTLEGNFTGCQQLREAIVVRVKPRLHIFGHIHEAYGTYFDGTTTFVNASTCTRAYRATNLPIVIDLPLDPGMPAQVVDYDAQTFEEPVDATRT